MGVGADGGGGAGVEGKDDEVAAGAGGGPVAAHRRPLQQALHRIPGRPLLGAGGRRRDPRPRGGRPPLWGIRRWYCHWVLSLDY